MKILSATTQLSEAQKICVLSFDEMKIRKAFCYARSSDTTLSPANYVQVAMLRGLISKWKQPVFYAFDCQIPADIIHHILGKVRESGYNIVAIISDLGGGNRALYRNLEVTMEKPWFIPNENKVFAFSDVPHLIKLMRNNLIDHGFTIYGEEVRKEIILTLLSLTSGDFSITHKITTGYLSLLEQRGRKFKWQ